MFVCGWLLSSPTLQFSYSVQTLNSLTFLTLTYRPVFGWLIMPCSGAQQKLTQCGNVNIGDLPSNSDLLQNHKKEMQSYQRIYFWEYWGLPFDSDTKGSK